MEFRARIFSFVHVYNTFQNLKTRFSRNMIFQNGTQHKSNNLKSFYLKIQPQL